jgi:hypothetical protein
MHAFNVTTQPQINYGPVTTWPTHNDVHTNTNNQECKRSDSDSYS